MKFSEVRQYLTALVEADTSLGGERKLASTSFLNGLARLDDKTVEEVDQMLTLLFKPKKPVSERKPKQPPAAAPGIDVQADALTRLRSAFDDDGAFRNELDQLQVDRNMSREALNNLYCQLFGKSRKLPSKASKAKLVQDIADLRLERVRSKRAATLLSGAA